MRQQIRNAITHRVASGLGVTLVLGALGCNQDSFSPSAPEEPTIPWLATAATRTLAFLQVSGGEFHSCGVTTDGRAYCWGLNTSGQLGDGTTTERLAPVAVVGGLRFRHVSVGYAHSCGVTTQNRAYCWGNNFWGQVGDGTEGGDNWRVTPVLVAGGRRFRQVRAGYDHTCALTPSDVAFCWGHNSFGQLGDGTTALGGRTRPVRVLGGLLWRQLSGGSEHTCGITQTYQVYCWGLNNHGQLGNGTTAHSVKPAPVSGGRQFRQVAAGGFHTCAVTTGNLAYCWGLNFYGALGDGTTAPRLTAGAVAGLRRFHHVTTGDGHTCGVTLTGKGFCWGNNENGRLGDGTTANRVKPVQLGINLELRQVAAGLRHTCGVTTGNRAYCWGTGGGRLGDGTTSHRLLPVPVAAPM
jgi:alpha-tubulin suppressor-like RCC1 family protein